MTTVGQVEIDAACREVLARHWPDVARHDDVRTAADWWTSEHSHVRVDVVSGGLPCQPFSVAGDKRGTDDDRWLWPAMFELVRTVRPRYVIVENVAHLLKSPAFGVILGDLARARFDADWTVFTACAVGGPHMRRRLFLVAHPHGVDGRSRLGDRHPGETSLRSTLRTEHGWGDERVWLPAARASYRVVDRAARRLVARGGNAVVPAMAQVIGRYVMAMESGVRGGTSQTFDHQVTA